MNIKTDLSAGIIIFNKKMQNFLLIKQNNEIWGFPKGHPNKNETLILAAKRELFEETGINLDNLLSNKKNVFFDKNLFRSEYEFVSKNTLIKKEVYFFLLIVEDFMAENVKINIEKKEIMEYRFINEVGAKNLFNFSETKDFLDRIVLFLKNYKFIS